MPEICYGYHEVKLYLAHHHLRERPRRRGLPQARASATAAASASSRPAGASAPIVDARNFTEMVAIQMVLQDSLTLAQYEYGEKYAKNPAEKYIFAHAMQDKARHVAYGITHLKYVLMHRAERREEIQRYLDKGEGMLLQDDKKDPATRDAFAIYFAGGKANIQEGLRSIDQMRKRPSSSTSRGSSGLRLIAPTAWTPGLRAYIRIMQGGGMPTQGAERPSTGENRIMPTFPSVEWFNAIKDIVNNDPAFRQLGTVDSVIGVKVGSKIFELTFEAFECTGVREVERERPARHGLLARAALRQLEGHAREHQEERRRRSLPHPQHDRPQHPGRLRALARRLPPRRLLPLQPVDPGLLQRLGEDRHAVRLAGSRQRVTRWPVRYGLPKARQSVGPFP